MYSNFPELMAQCSKIAYENGTKAKPLYKELGFTKHKYFSKKGAQCHVISNDGYLVLAFRGTEVKEFSDIKADLKVRSTNNNFGKGRVHRGFNAEVDKLWDDLRKYVRDNLTNQKLVVTGHSLGASMGVIFTARIQYSFKVDSLWTYGCPRAGNQKFVDSVKTTHYRFVNNNDDVPKVPFYHWGYRHFGNLMYIDSKGKVQKKSRMWQRVRDRLKGRLDAVKTKDFFDGIKDHSIVKYVKHLKGFSL